MELNKRRIGLMTSQILKDCKTLKDKNDAFMSSFTEYSDIKLNFAVFNQDMQCVKILKCVDLVTLFKFMAWSGYRNCIDQVLIKMKYSLEAEKDLVSNICLDRSFNLNILMVPTKKVINL